MTLLLSSQKSSSLQELLVNAEKLPQKNSVNAAINSTRRRENEFLKTIVCRTRQPGPARQE